MFDRYVEGTKPSWKRRAVIIASIVLHAGAAVALFVYSIFHVEEITPPALSLTFFSAPPPPPPPPPPAAHKKTVEHKITPKVTQPITPQTIIQPKKEEPEEEDDGEEGGVEGGVAGGQKGGVLGGVIGGVVGGTGGGPPGPPAKPKNVPPYMLEQAKLSGDNPHLPDIVKIQRKGTGDAVAMVKMCVDQQGKVSQVQILQGIPGADAEIMNTLRGWKFKPQPIPICSLTRFVFTIN